MTPSAVERRTSSGAWVVVFPRVYLLDGAAFTWTRRLRGASLWAGRGSALSHETAAALWRLEGFGPGPVAVTTERSLKAPAGVYLRRVRCFGPADTELLEGMTVTTPARTLLDLAAVGPEEKVDAALDHALRSGLVSLPKLRWFVQTSGGRGRAGTAALRRLLAARPQGYVPVESALERKVWNLIVRSGLPRPVRQHEVFDGKKLVARVDLAFPEALVAVEADGYRWHSGRRAWSHDLSRRNRLTALGWRVLHVTDEDIRGRPGEVVEQVRRMLSDRTLSLDLR